MEPIVENTTAAITEEVAENCPADDPTDKAVDTPAASSAAKESDADVAAVDSSKEEQKPMEVAMEDFAVDPLQVARQVAIEAKLEVDGMAHSSSSSDKLPAGDEQQHSPEVDFVPAASADESSSAPDSRSSGFLMEEEVDEDAEKVAAAAAQEVEQSQLTEVPQAESGKSGKGDFDLNKEAGVVVSAAAPAIGSAVTSAFRPVSPRRKTGAADGSTGGSTSSRGIGVDLNAVVSGESVGGKIGFDLNQPTDEAEEPPAPVDWRAEAAAQQRQRGLSPSSSASSRRHFDLNNQVLPAAVDQRRAGGTTFISIMGTKVEVPRSHHHPPPPPPPPAQSHQAVPQGYSSIHPYHQPGLQGYSAPAIYTAPGGAGAGGYQYLVDSRGVPVVPQLMGSAPAHQPYYVTMQGGPPPGSAQMMMGSGSGQPPFFLNMSGGLPTNGSALPPLTGSLPAHQQYYMAMHGPQPSNGSGSAISQVTGPSPAHQHPYYQSTPPTNGPGPGSVPSRSNFDLNTGGNNRNIAPAAPGHGGRAREEYVTSSQASTSSGAGGKRKEPEGGSSRQQQQQSRPWM